MKKLISIILVFLFIAIQYKLWFDSDGLVQTIRISEHAEEQKNTVEEARDRNNKLISHINALKRSTGSIESLAREKLGMIKKSEIYYRIVG